MTRQGGDAAAVVWLIILAVVVGGAIGIAWHVGGVV